MTIRVRLYSILKKYLPANAAGNACTVVLKEGATVLDVVRSLDIPVTMPKILLVNGLQASLDGKEPLTDGDTVTLFPPMAGG